MGTPKLWGKNNKNPITMAAPAFVVGGLARNTGHGARIYRVLAIGTQGVRLQWLGTNASAAVRPSVHWYHPG